MFMEASTDPIMPQRPHHILLGLGVFSVALEVLAHIFPARHSVLRAALLVGWVFTTLDSCTERFNRALWALALLVCILYVFTDLL